MRQRPAGFTLIELMIVVAIISIVASIAIPNLMRGRMAANEVAAMTALKAIGTGQEVFRKASKDWPYPGHTPGVMQYADRFYRLFKVNDTMAPVQYVDEGLARASATWPAAYGPAATRTGYWFCDVDFIRVGGTWRAMDPKVSFAVYAAPSQYNLTGLSSYYMDSRSQVWMKDITDGPLTDKMPSNPAELMFVVNE